LKVDSTAPHCLLKNGMRYQIAAYGNVVTAFEAEHDWRKDVDLLVQQQADYARLWDKLGGETQEWPWLKVGAKWDLSKKNPVYWARLDEVATTCNSKGIVLEVMIFDRGLGGHNADYRVYPWHPANNVNGTGSELPEGGLGTPEFYEVDPGGNVGRLQTEYVRWYAEWAKKHPNVILEIENENRAVDANNGRDWALRFARLIKNVSPNVLVSFNSLNLEVLSKTYPIREVDIVNVHFGQDGDNPMVLDRYCRDNWSKNKPINVDEFANGLKMGGLLNDMCATITKAGCHFHIEDADAVAQPEQVAKGQRDLIDAKGNDPFCATGPSGPPPPCPKETRRGHSILYVNDRNNNRVCTGNNACTEMMRDGKLKVGYIFEFDSTALEGIQRPIPKGCGDCLENPTKWTWDGGLGLKVNDACGAKLVPQRPGRICSISSSGVGSAVCKGIDVR